MNKDKRFIYISLFFVFTAGIFSLMKLYNTHFFTNMFLYIKGEEIYPYRTIIENSESGHKKYYFIDDLNLPAEVFYSFNITLTSSGEFYEKPSTRNTIYFIFTLKENAETQQIETGLFLEPLGQKENHYTASVKNVEGFRGIVESIIIGPFKRKDISIESIKIINDPLLDIAIFLRHNDLISYYLPIAFLFFSILVFLKSKLVPLKCYAPLSEKPLARYIISSAFFSFIVFSIFFPFEIMFPRLRFFNILEVDFSSILIISFFFLALAVHKTGTGKNHLIFSASLLFWGFHIFAGITNIVHITRPDRSFYIVLNSLAVPFLIFLISTQIFHKDDIVPIIKGLFIPIVTLSVLSFAEVLTGHNILYDNIINLYFRAFYSFHIGKRASSTLVHPLVFSSLLLLYLPLFYNSVSLAKKRYEKLFFLASSIALLVSLILTGSRGAIIITLLFFLYYLTRGIISSKKAVIYSIALITCSMIIIFVISDRGPEIIQQRFLPFGELMISEEFQHRAVAYIAVYNTLQKDPLFGSGLGSVNAVMRKYTATYTDLSKISYTWYTTDNYYLYILLERGLIGFLTLFIPIFYIFYRSFSIKTPDSVKSLRTGLILFLIHISLLDGLNWILLYSHFYFFLGLLFLTLSSHNNENQ